MIFNPPEIHSQAAGDATQEPSYRFHNWRGFLAAAIAVNLLFLYGMLNNTTDPDAAIWFKVLAWLPFNAIATAMYLVFMIKLGKANPANHQTGGLIYALISGFMLVANWIALIAA